MAHGIDLMIREALSQIERPEYAMVAFLSSGALVSAIREIDHRLGGATMTVDHIPWARDVILEFVRASEAAADQPQAEPEPPEPGPAFFPGPVEVRIPPPGFAETPDPAAAAPARLSAADLPDAGPAEGSPDDREGLESSPSRIAALRDHITMLVVEGLVTRWQEGEMSAAEAVQNMRSATHRNPSP